MQRRVAVSDIFVSYAREDLGRVRPLVKLLEARGWSVFLDQAIPAGQEWRSHIQQSIAEAGCVVVLWSTTSVTSHHVQEEAESGRNRGVLIPAMIAAVTPPFG